MKKFIMSLIAVAGLAVSINGQINVELIGKLSPAATIYSDIWGYTDANGREYALMGANDGTYIIDLGNPAEPKVVTLIAGPPSIWRDIKVYDKYAYVVTEGEGSGEGLQIIDLSNLPVSASLVKTVSSFFTSAHNIFIENGFAFVVGARDGGGMHILNLSDPVNPIETAYYSASGYIHDVYAWGDTVIAAAESKYAMVDISDKANPVKVSESAGLPGYAHSGWMSEDKRYFFGTDELNVRDLTIFDLKDRSNWNMKIYSWQHPDNTIIHNIFIKGNYAHISYYESGYVVLDITDPLNPYLIGQYDTFPTDNPDYNGVWGCYPYFDSGLTIISDRSTGLYVLKFTPADPSPMIFDVRYEEFVLNTDPVKLFAKITDNNNVDAVNLFYRTKIDGQISNWEMIGNSAAVSDVYDFTLPGQEGKTIVEFYFAASDDRKHVSTSPKGGGGLNPVGKNAPDNYYSYQIVIAGPPIIQSVSPDVTDITVNRGERVEFSVEAEDTTGLELIYRWFSNGFSKGGRKNYSHGTAFGAAPRIDTVKLVVSNGFYSVERLWYVHVDIAVSVEEDNNNLTYGLRQNYPNPFNPSTTISFSIAEAAHVNLTVINMLGQVVAELINGNMVAGEHNVNFNAGEMPSGTYFYRLAVLSDNRQSGSFVEVKKMQLIK